MPVQLVNAKINSNAALNTNKYKHGDTVRLNVVLTYRNYGSETTSYDNITVTCDYIQFYKNTDLGTWVSANKTTPLTITEPTGTFNFEANTGSSIDVNSFDVSNSITGTLEVKGYLDVVLENPEFGNSFKFQFTDSILGVISGYKYSYDITANRIVSLNDNAGNGFNVKTDVDSIFRNGVSIKNYIPYKFVYGGSHTFSNGEVSPVNLTMDGGIYSHGHILVLDSQEGVSIPNGQFIAMFRCLEQIKVTDTLTFVFGPDKNSNITKAFSGALAFCSQEFLSCSQLAIVRHEDNVDVLFEAGTEAMVLVDLDTGFNAIYPLNTNLPEYEICLDVIAESASEEPVTFNAITLSDEIAIPNTPTTFPITRYDNGEPCSLTLNSAGYYYGLTDGYIRNSGVTENYYYTSCKVYYKRKYLNVEDVIFAINSLPNCEALFIDDGGITPLTSINFWANVTYKARRNSQFGYTRLKAIIGGTVIEPR